MPNPNQNRRNVGDPVGKRLRQDAVLLALFENASNLGFDSSGRGNSLTNNNSVSQVAGKVGQAANFVSGSSQYLSVANNATIQLGGISFAVCLWVKLAAKAFQALASKRHSGGSSTTDTFGFDYFNTPDRFRFFVGGASGFTIATANSFGSPSTGVWYFIVGQYNLGANTASIQVNNGAVDSTSLAGQTPPTNSDALLLGAHAGPNTFLNGAEDQVLILPRLLTAQESAYLYAGGAGRNF